MRFWRRTTILAGSCESKGRTHSSLGICSAQRLARSGAELVVNRRMTAHHTECRTFLLWRMLKGDFIQQIYLPHRGGKFAPGHGSEVE